MTDKNKFPVPATDDDSLDEATDRYLRAEQRIIDAINASLKEDETALRPIPTDVVLRRGNAEQAEATIHAVYTLLGGAAGYAAWAIDHRDDFYTTVYPKLLKSRENISTTGGQITIISPLPQTAADAITLDSSGRATAIIEHPSTMAIDDSDEDFSDDDEDEEA